MQTRKRKDDILRNSLNLNGIPLLFDLRRTMIKLDIWKLYLSALVLFRTGSFSFQGFFSAKEASTGNCLSVLCLSRRLRIKQLSACSSSFPLFALFPVSKFPIMGLVNSANSLTRRRPRSFCHNFQPRITFLPLKCFRIRVSASLPFFAEGIWFFLFIPFEFWVYKIQRWYWWQLWTWKTVN